MTSAKTAPTASDYWLFVREFVRAPIRTGAIAPSSRRLAETVSAIVPEEGDPVVVELGPGTGAFTGEIQDRLGGRGRHVAVELNAELAELVGRRFPKVEVVSADAKDLQRILAERDLGRADAVISGLPWAAFPASLQRDILAAVTAGLAPTGSFTTFAYIHARPARPATRFRELLRTRFDDVVESGTIWGNLPPAFVYRARRPRPATGNGNGNGNGG
jgi:phosphatidylethanolamine/phosphatidyl-N-methylethanolamine N-methyltransferase